MEEGKEKTEGIVTTEREEIFSKAVRAGKRTYFFDVKATRRNDYYLTITESKKRFHKDGRFFYEKHKIFLYKEDFDKFIDGLTEAVDFIKEAKPEEVALETTEQQENTQTYTDVEFEDLEKVEATTSAGDEIEE
ncbi:MAG: PUR family DNA/RNA-binding protein [Bacteroidales bacterium]|nr:PUR family DNA/RNA-binding protein [Bacteroidales bacterium]